MTAPLLPYPRRADTIALRAHVQLVLVGALALVLGIGWAASTSLDRVTRGGGRVVPQSNNKVVQHLEGGIVTEILVREGDLVAEGAPLLRIDNSFSRAEEAQNRVELRAKRLQVARLDAEGTGAATFTVDEATRADLPLLVESELSLFRARVEGLKAQLAVIEEQSRQKTLELSELNSRWQNTQRDRELVSPRVEGMRRLAQMGAISRNELLDNERTLQQIEAKLSEMTFEIPRAEAAIVELGRRREETVLRFRAEAEKERREAGVQVAKLERAVDAMQDRSRRSEVVAPVAGTVNKLFVSTVGGIVKSGEPLAQIVPAEASIVVEARLSPQDRAQVWPGLPAVVKISAYDYAIYGGLRGKVLDVSPDALNDEKGEPFFRVRLEAAADTLGPGRPVVPGMLAQVDILTGRHTVLDYLVRPIRRVANEALRQ